MRLTSAGAVIAALGVAALAPRISNACVPVTPLPTLRETVARADHVYMAHLVSLKRTRIKGSEKFYPNIALEDATFQILMTLKGPAQKGGTIATRTEVAGNCRLSLVDPVYRVPETGPLVAIQKSDVWILVVSGREPYELFEYSNTRPINAFSERDLRFLLTNGRKP